MLARVDPEFAQQFAQLQARHVLGMQASIADQPHERQHAGQQGQRHRGVTQRDAAGDGGDQQGADHHAQRLRDADPRTAGRALLQRHLIRQFRHQCRHHRVQRQLRRAPVHRDREHALLPAEQPQRQCATDAAGEDPRPAPAEARGGAIRPRAEQRIGEHRHQRAGPGHPAQRGLLVARGQQFHLLRQQYLDRREERRPQAEEGQRVEADEACADARAGFGKGAGGHVHCCAAISCRYQWYEAFGVRIWFSKSTCTRPKRGR